MLVSACMNLARATGLEIITILTLPQTNPGKQGNAAFLGGGRYYQKQVQNLDRRQTNKIVLVRILYESKNCYLSRIGKMLSLSSGTFKSLV